MGGKVINFLLKFAVPVILLIILFSYNSLVGLAALLLAIAFLFYKGRASAFANIGKLKYSGGNIEEALTWFERAYATGKSKPATTTSYAYLLLKTGRLEESETILNKLISSRPDKDNEMLAKSNLALAIWKKGCLDDAIALLEAVINDYKTSAVYGSLGYLLILKGDLEKALQFNLEAYEYNDSNTVILDNLGLVYHLTGQFEKSAEIYEKLMLKNPTFPEAYYNYGLLLSDINQTEKAVEMMEKALNYKLSFLSTIKREDIEQKLEETRQKLPDSKE
ncbi:MAG: tetratricopeptide repeat protein [Ruminiclostridium sp.]|nr:tetratricopeptide repeat protein [Ruminiclostridium sp.]